MYPLVESIKIIDGQIYNLSLHEERLNRCRNEIYGKYNLINLMDYIKIPQEFLVGLIKCRILYNEEIIEVSFQPYQIRNIKSIQVIQNDLIEYSYKFVERTDLDELYNNKGISDEIIIIKKGYVTDAYYYNYIFERENEMYTPKSPLLSGVMRSQLLKENKIKPIDISLSDLQTFDKIYLINAMTSLGEIELNRSQIHY